MAKLIRDLINFEEVEEVIKIRKDEKAREYVEKYVISQSLRDNLAYMLDVLSSATHKSFNIVGNYGTGKSHFLAFVAALLEHPEYRAFVNEELIAKKAQELNRRYLVVKFELGAAQEIPLRYIFFDQIYRQLLEKYDIEVRKVDLKSSYDNKQTVLDILSDIKAEDPEVGLVVVVDEISDFLKQKTRQNMDYDLTLLRELGEVSQDSDFLYIGAMQEHVFSNPKYVDQAESISHFNQRFVTITITKDDVSQVLTQRVVNKNTNQRKELQILLEDYRKYFPNLANQLDRYINLFPIHPYVIDVFEQLPYFENRGIIGFAVQNVQPILDQPAPMFITYDRVFDRINATHEIRNLPSVAQVVNVVQTLEAKVDLLDTRYREDAKKLIKALAVLKLLGGDNKNGATSQELANTLLITPPGKMLVEPEMARDNIERIMKNIRDVTVGQYIDYGEGRYFLNLTKVDDYDAYIEKKAQSSVINNPAEIEAAFLKHVLDELNLTRQSPYLPGKAIYDDTAQWSSRRSFRYGLFIVGRGDEGALVQHGDYRFVMQGPGAVKNLGQQNEVVLSVSFSDKLIGFLVRARAAELLANENIHKKIMTQISNQAYQDFGKEYLKQLIESGSALQGGHKTDVSKLPSQKPLNALSDVIDHVKSRILDTFFVERYPNHPTFSTLLTSQNVESEMSRALQSLDRQVSVQLDLNSRGYLESFGAMKDGHFSASESAICRLILERVEANDQANKLTSLEDLIKELGQKPWGLTPEMVYLLLGALLFNGYLVFVRQGGTRLHAGDVSPLLKQGLEFFKDIRYLERDRDINVEAVVAIFAALSLQTGLVRDKDSRSEAVKALHQRGVELKEKLATVRQGMQSVVAEAANFSEVPWLIIQDTMSHLAGLEKPLNQFAEVTRVADLGHLDGSPETVQNLKNNLASLEIIGSFLHDWREGGISAGLLRMQQSLTALPQLATVIEPSKKNTISELERIAADSKTIYTDAKQLLTADLRRPLKGKLEQFRQKYDSLYYNLHQNYIGDQAPWGSIQQLRQSVEYVALGQIKGLPFISPAPFNQIALEIQSLERRRCDHFTAQVLDTFAICPYCNFPEEGENYSDLPSRLQKIQKRLEELWITWENQVLSELDGLSGRLALLSTQSRVQVEAILKRGELPKEITLELINALYEFFSELQPIELDLADLGQYLLKSGNALTEEELRSLLDVYVDSLIKGSDRQLARIKIMTSN